MGNLIRAQFYRYRRSGLFWLSMLACLIFGYICGEETAYVYHCYGFHHGRFNALLFLPLFIILAVFLSAAIGREYSDGTLRNQVIAGSTRACIFGSQLLCSVLVSLLFSALFVGTFLYRAWEIPLAYLPVREKLSALAILLCVNCTFAVLFTVGSLSIPSRELGLLFNLFLLGCLVISSGATIGRLNQLEMLPDPSPKQVEMTSEEVAAFKEGSFPGSVEGQGGPDGIMTYYKYVMDPLRQTPNPRYLRGAQRKAAEIWISVVPYGQISQTVDHLNNLLTNEQSSSTPVLFPFPAYCLGLSGLVALAGLAVFRKKELR